MKIVALYVLTLLSSELLSQSFFSKVYKVQEDGTGIVNQAPNYLSAILPTDSLIFAFGYSADTTYPRINGTAFYVFNWTGVLLKYFHIKDGTTYNFFNPEGIVSWDGETFYTGFNNFYQQQSILKYNRFTNKQDVLEITNSSIKNGDILRSNLVSTLNGELITANEIAIDSTMYNYRIQVTKIDTNGSIKWQRIVGNNPINGFQNHCFSCYTDSIGNIFVGVDYNDNLGLGWEAQYQSILYKLDSGGSVVDTYASKLSKTGFNTIYDIVKANDSFIYLCSDYNYNNTRYPFNNLGFGAIQVLDSNLSFKRYIPLDFRDSNGGPAFSNSFEKIIQSNNNRGLILGGSLPVTRDTLMFLTDSIYKLDSILGQHFLLNLIQIRDNKVEWRRVFRIRSGKDNGYLYDIKSCPKGGYIIAAASFLGDAYEKYGDPYWMPWLLRVDDDGCMIPGCGTVSTKNQDKADQLIIYPNPANNYIVLLHTSQDKTRYQIVSAEGKIMDDFYSTIEGEQIIVPIQNYNAGSYYLRSESKNGVCSQLFIKQ